MQTIEQPIADVKLIIPPIFGDDRGHFSEVYNQRSMAAIGIDAVFVQQNVSLSRITGTLRGLHYQRPPSAQAKLVRCVRGAIWDVAVDIRSDSPTFGQHVGVELSAENRAMLFVPRGFLHGFLTLAPDTEVSYMVDGFYDREADGSVRFDDPDLAVAWPFAEHGIDPATLVLSEKDKVAPFLKDSVTGF